MYVVPSPASVPFGASEADAFGSTLFEVVLVRFVGTVDLGLDVKTDLLGYGPGVMLG